MLVQFKQEVYVVVGADLDGDCLPLAVFRSWRGAKAFCMLNLGPNCENAEFWEVSIEKHILGD